MTSSPLLPFPLLALNQALGVGDGGGGGSIIFKTFINLCMREGEGGEKKLYTVYLQYTVQQVCCMYCMIILLSNRRPKHKIGIWFNTHKYEKCSMMFLLA
jgi:hypothetical protein